MQQITISKRIIIPLLFLLIPIVLIGCKGQSEELKTILTESDNITNLITTGTETRNSVVDKGTALGKDVNAYNMVNYVPTDSHSLEEVYEEFIVAFEKNNWKKSPPTIYPDTLEQFTKTMNGDKYSAFVNMNIDENKIVMEIEEG